MTNIHLTPDSIVFVQFGFFKLNATIVCTWAVMAILVVGSILLTRRLTTGPNIPKWQHILEKLVLTLRDQIKDMMQQKSGLYLPFLGTLFLFISISNLLMVVPYYEPPTGSLSVTAALAVCVLFAVPVFGIYKTGVKEYLKKYIQPSVFMLPFNIISELSRTLALAVRLFGNIMSSRMIGAVVISIAPLFVPLIMEGLGLIIGQIQAYIFAALATVYIASATEMQKNTKLQKEATHG
jgi:F-type H+-transporting ATPase subunit a